MRGEQYFEQRLVKDARKIKYDSVWFAVLIRIVVMAILAVFLYFGGNWTIKTYEGGFESDNRYLYK